MDANTFDHLARRTFADPDRRRLLAVTGALAAGMLAGPASLAAKKKKKKTFCLDGSTVKASGKKIKQVRKQGATPGACCVPQCNGTSCGGDDGCGGTCGCNVGAVCNAGICIACTVTCTGTAVGCGSDLMQALQDGGTIAACPGRYAGTFAVSESTVLVGAGAGDDPATSTILDASGAGRVITVDNGKAFSAYGIRVTGGAVTGQGGGLLGNTGSDVRIDACAFVGNGASTDGGAIAALEKLTLRNSQISGNTAVEDGGGVFLRYGPASFISNCSITGNTGGYGGGVRVRGTTSATITATEIQGNTATARGGGIYCDSTVLTLDSATSIIGNTAAQGGGIYVFTGVTFNQNGATISGNTPASPQCVNVTCT